MRVGIVGCGRQGIGHGRAWLALRERGVELVGAADPTPARLEVAAAELGLPAERLHAEPRALIERPDVDVLSITSPQRFHHGLVLAAAAAGKQILCEKPIANAPADAAEMVAACQRAGVRLAMVHNYRWYDDGVKAVIDSGAIGRPLVVTLNALGVIDYPGVGEYRPAWRHAVAEAGGGVLMDMLHYVYLVELLIGAPIARVSASVDRRLSDDQDVEDTALCRFTHANGGFSVVNVAWGEGPGGLDVMGERGRIRLQYRHGGTLPFQPAERIEVVDATGTLRTAPIAPRDGRRIFADFVEAVEQGRPPVAPGEEGQRSLEAVVAVYASGATGRDLTLPLATDSPIYRRGALGISELDLPPDSPARRLGLFGVARER